MDQPLLRGLTVLLCCFRVLSGALLNREYAAQALYQQHLYIDKKDALSVVQCRMCHISFPGKKCIRGRGICSATAAEACMIGNVFKNDKTPPSANDENPWLTFMGCLKNCANVNSVKWSIYLVNFRCCRSYDFCNELLLQ